MTINDKEIIFNRFHKNAEEFGFSLKEISNLISNLSGENIFVAESYFDKFQQELSSIQENIEYIEREICKKVGVKYTRKI